MSYNIRVVEPEDESQSHFLTSCTNTLGLDLAADSYNPSNQPSFPTHNSHHGLLPSGSSVQYNTYGSAAVAENPRPTLAHLNTTLGHSLTRSPINSGLHSSSLSSTNNSPVPFLRDDIDTMRPYPQHPQQMWGPNTGLSSPDPRWNHPLSSPFNHSSPGMHDLSPLSTYLQVDPSPPPSSISSPGSQGSPLAGSHQYTPSPRQDAPPLTPQSMNGSHYGVRIQSSPSQYPTFFPDASTTTQMGNAMDGPLTYPPLLSPLPVPSSSYVTPNQIYNGMPMYNTRPSAGHPFSGHQGFVPDMMGIPFPQQPTCNPTAVLGPTTTEGPMVPQTRYRPHTSSDQRRYVDEVALQEPIFFYVSSPNGPKPGIPLRDAITSKFMRLTDRDEQLFQGCGPSISVRLSWKGYQPWSRQIPTRDFRSPPGPITKAKLAKNVAKSVQRFIEEHKDREMEPGAELQWAVGPGKIDVDDLLLVSMVHVSMGSWQANLQLNRPLR